MRSVCKILTLKVGERMYRKITSIHKTISKGKTKERIREQLQQRKREKNHLALISRKMGMMMSIVGSCIWS
jgi:hypothetical protein